MSNTYLIYTEMLIDGEWRCIDGYRMHKSYGRDEEKMTLFCTYENGSRSSFGETYEELKCIGRKARLGDLSKEVQGGFSGDIDEDWFECVVVPCDDFMSHVPEGYSYHAIIHKDQIADYESGEIDELWQDDGIDFSKMSDLEKQCYEYYEWDDHCSWQYWFKQLKEMIDFTVNKYYNNEWLLNGNEVRIVVFCL